MRTYYPNQFLFLVLFLFGFNGLSSAQQLPIFLSQIRQPDIYQPARMYDGNINLNYRRQWLDLSSDDAPTSYFASVDLSQLLNLQQHKIGAGLFFIGDIAHIFETNRLGINFAYHLIDTREQRLSAGIQASYTLQSLTFGDRRINDPFDLALFSGEYQDGVFDGGPGITYQYFNANGSRLSLDLSVLQLLSSQLDYTDGPAFNFDRHLMARASYLIQTEALGIEPTVLFRQSLDEQQLKDDNIDVAIQAHFLDRFTLVAGTRIGADIYHLSFAVDISGPIGISAGYETHPVFGGTYEFGALIRTKDNLSDPLTKYRSALKKIRDEVLQKDRNISSAISNAKQNLRNAENPDFSIEARRNNLNKVENSLTELELLVQDIQGKPAESQISLNQAREAAADNTSLKGLEDYQTEIEQTVNQRRNDLKYISSKIEELKLSLYPSAREAIQRGDLAGIQSYFRNRIQQLSGLPTSLDDIIVKKLPSGDIEVALPYANDRTKFDLRDDALSDVRHLIDFIGKEITQIISEGNQVLAVDVIANLREPLELLDIESGAYNGEFGTSSTSVSYEFRDNNTRLSNTTTKIIKTGPVLVEQLVALKLSSIKQRLVQRGVPVNRIRLRMNAPNQQQNQQHFLVRIQIQN